MCIRDSIRLAKRLIEEAKQIRADAIKFQIFKAEKIVSPDVPQASYQAKNIGKKESQYNMLKRLELPYTAFRELKAYCSEKGIIFLATPHSGQKDVDLVAELCPAIKVGSGDLTNLPILKYIAKKKLPIILSTGMSTLKEVREAVETILPINKKLILLHCTTNYPTPLREVNLRAISTMVKEFNLPIGYSDHTQSLIVPVAAVVLGAVVIEKHFTLDKNLPGPDHKASLLPPEFKKMIKNIRDIEKRIVQGKNRIGLLKKLGVQRALGDGIKRPNSSEIEIAKVVRKSIVADTNIRKGTIIKPNMLAIKRPGTGIEPKYFNKVIYKVAIQNIKKGQPLHFNQFQ